MKIDRYEVHIHVKDVSKYFSSWALERTIVRTQFLDLLDRRSLRPRPPVMCVTWQHICDHVALFCDSASD